MAATMKKETLIFGGDSDKRKLSTFGPSDWSDAEKAIEAEVGPMADYDLTKAKKEVADCKKNKKFGDKAYVKIGVISDKLTLRVKNPGKILDDIVDVVVLKGYASARESYQTALADYMKWKELTIQDVLRDKNLLKEFATFCNKTLCAENLMFYLESGKTPLSDIAKQTIVEKYINEDSQYQINIDGPLARSIKEPAQAGRWQDVDFTQAREVVLSLLNNDSLFKLVNEKMRAAGK